MEKWACNPRSAREVAAVCKSEWKCVRKLTGTVRNWTVDSLFASRVEAELLQLGMQRRAGNAEQLGRVRLVAFRTAEGFRDDKSFDPVHQLGIAPVAGVCVEI